MKKNSKNWYKTRALKMFVGLFVLISSHSSLLAQATHNVSVLNNSFEPSTLTIEVGDTVIWSNSSGFHNVNGTTGTYASNPESFGNSTGTNWTYSHVFTLAGTYDYQCDPHVGFGMVGLVIVEQINTLTVSFSGMTPHVGQLLELYLFDTENSVYVDTFTINSISEAEFEVTSNAIMIGGSYNIDFFADLSGNETYDAPPTDHAWRITLENVQGDTTINFSHNTDFIDIMESGSTSVEGINNVENVIVYPNPAKNKISLMRTDLKGDIGISIHNLSGQLMYSDKIINTDNRIDIDINELPVGSYFIKLKAGSGNSYYKFVKTD